MAMSDEQAQIVLLTDALEQAQSTVEFLHGCLTDPLFQYAYPEMTARHLERWHELAPRAPGCVHSRTYEDCPSCQHRVRRAAQLQEAQATLAGADEPPGIER